MCCPKGQSSHRYSLLVLIQRTIICLCLVGMVGCGQSESSDSQKETKTQVELQAPTNLIETPSPPTLSIETPQTQPTVSPVNSEKPSEVPHSSLTKEAEKYCDIGKQAYEQEELNEAIEYFTQSLDLREDEMVRLVRALACIEKKDYPSALDDLNLLLEAYPRLSKVLMLRGACYREQGDVNRALADFTAAIEHDPSAVSALVMRATIWFNLRVYKLAIPDWEAVLEMNPSFLNAHISLGVAYSVLGQRELGKQHWQRAIQLAPQDPQVYLARGVSQGELHEYKEAIDAFETALSLQPDSLKALNQLSMLYAACEDGSLRNQARAWELANRACELSGWNQSEYLAALATVHAQGGNFLEAIRWQQESLRFTSDELRAELQLRLQMYQRNETPYITTSTAQESTNTR